MMIKSRDDLHDELKYIMISMIIKSRDDFHDEQKHDD